MKKHIVYLQVMTDTNSNDWDSVVATKHELENPGEVAQTISNVAGTSVRMTYHMDGVRIGSLNGHYFRPQPQTLISPSTVCETI